MKQIFLAISCVALLVLGCNHSSSIKTQNAEFTRLADTVLYINDEKSSLAVYEFMSSRPEKYVPLKESLAEMGYETEEIEQNMLLVETPGQRNVCMRIQNGEIEHRVVMDGDYSFLDEAWKSHRVSKKYIIENNVIYYPLDELTIAVGCYEYRNGNTIYLDSETHYKENHTICQNIGRKVNVTAYINDIRIDSPVYYNTIENEANTLGFFVELVPVSEAIGANVEYISPNIVKVMYGDLQYTFNAERIYEDGKEMRFDDADEDCYIVDGKTYVKFSTIRVKTDGSLRQADEYNMYLYTPDFERRDIPATLQEAYAYFNENLNDADIDFIKNCTEDELITSHFGLGRWIRNNWLDDMGRRIEKVFADKGITEHDDISGYIIEGYKAYLNGQPCEIDDLIN